MKTAVKKTPNDAKTPYLARRIRFRAPREHVFDAVATLDGLRGWWTTIVSGSAATGGEVLFEFAGLDEAIVMRVDEAGVLPRSSGPAWCTPTLSSGAARQ